MRRSEAAFPRFEHASVRVDVADYHRNTLGPSTAPIAANSSMPAPYQILPQNAPKMVHNDGMLPKLRAAFYAQPGSEPPSQPVRAWLKRLPDEDRKEIGADIQSVQFGWP